MKRVQLKKSVNIIPSLFTTGSMFFAFFSIVRSINGDHQIAAWAILLASFFDAVDGRIARLTKTQSDFGKEYDSLVDLSSCGLAPAILVYTWALQSFKPIGWFFAFLFFACTALRLARFNIQVGVIEKKTFNGLPSPGAACLLATFVLFCEEVFGTPSLVQNWGSLILVPLLAVLMVSRVPYRSFKEYDMQKSNYFPILLGAAAVIGLIAINPPIVLFGGYFVYMLSGPLGRVVTLKRGKKKEAVPAPTKSRTKGKRFSVIPFTKKAEENDQRSLL